MPRVSGSGSITTEVGSPESSDRDGSDSHHRRRNVTVWKNQNLIRQSAVRQGDWKYLRIYNLKDNIAEEKDLAKSHGEKLTTMSNGK